VIVPTLDEAENIDETVAAVLREGDRASLDLELVVVDDGSTDGTRERVKQWESKDSRVRLISRDGERGLSGAVLAGARAASGGVIVVMDADLSHPAAALPALSRAILEDGYDMAIGSRYIPGGGTPSWPWKRRILSKLAAALGRRLVDAHDPGSGFFAIRRETLLETGKAARGFKIGLEILARLGPGARIKEVPIAFRDRTRGSSKLGAGVALTYLEQLVSLAGGAVSGGNALRFVVVSLLGLLLDLSFFRGFLRGGFSLEVAHMGSFAAASAAGYLLHTIWTFGGPKQRGGAWQAAIRFAAFVSVTLLAVFLRGGALALCQRSWGMTPEAAILPAALVAAVVSFLGNVFFVFRAPGGPRDDSVSWRVAAVGVAVYLFALRVVYVGQVELLPQEAYYWNYSQHLDIGYLDHPPMVAWLNWLGTHVFGQCEFGVRAGAIAASLCALLFAFRLTENLLGRVYAGVVTVLIASLPFFFATGFLMTPDAPLVACWAGGLYFLERALVAGKGRAWVGVGICVGAGMLSKYTMALVALAALVYVLVDRPSRRWLLTPMPYVAAAQAILIFSPVIVWNLQNGWASFIFQGPRRWEVTSRFELRALILSVLVLITPLGLLGLARGLLRPCRGRLFGLVFTLVPFSIFVLASLHMETKLDWTGPVWLAAMPFMALDAVRAARASLARAAGLFPFAWKGTVLALLLAYGALFHYQVLGLPGASESVRPLGQKWRELGRQVEKIEDEVHARTGADPLVVGMDQYYLASALAFYDPNGDGAGETDSNNLFGRRGLMYDFWFPPAQQEGKTLLLVSETPGSLDSPAVLDRVDEADPIRDLAVLHDGVIVAHYFARVVHGYHGPRHLAASCGPSTWFG